MKLVKSTLLTAATLFGSSVYAHTSLTSSVPANNEMLDQSPTALSLNFSSPAHIMKLTLENESGQPITLDIPRSRTPETNYSIALPELPASSYSVSWVIMGEDTHKMSGEFGFMVHSSEATHKGHKHGSD